MKLSTFIKTICRERDSYRPNVRVRLYDHNLGALLYPTYSSHCYHDSSVTAEPTKSCMEQFGDWTVKKIYPKEYSELEISISDRKRGKKYDI